MRLLFNQPFRLYLDDLRGTLKLAYPMVAAQIGQMALQLTDSLMLGRVGTDALAASAFAGNLYSVPLVFGLAGFAYVGAAIAQDRGAGRPEDAASWFKNSNFLALVVGSMIGLICQLGYLFLPWLGQEERVLELSLEYFALLGWSSVPMFLFQVSKQASEGLGRPQYSLYVTIAGFFLNVVLNYVLIFGHLGFAPMGIVGAGIATLATRWFMCIALFLWIHQNTNLKILAGGVLSITRLRACLHLGIPSAAQGTFEVGAFSFASVMMGWISQVALAAHQIAINICALTYMVTMGLSFAAAVRVGEAVGRGDAKAAQRLGIGAIGFAGAFLGFLGILVYMFRSTIPPLYAVASDVQDLAATLLTVAALFQLVDAVQGVALGALRGLLDIRIPSVMTFFAYWVLALPLGYSLGFVLKFSAPGVWLGLAVGLLFVAIILPWRFLKLTARMKSKEEIEASLGLDRKA